MVDEYWSDNGVRLTMIAGDCDSGERFGYVVSAADPSKRAYMLACVSQRAEENGTVVFPIWYELSDNEGRVLWRSKYIGVLENAQRAGNVTYDRAKKVLFHEMGAHLDGEINLRDRVKKPY